MISGLLTIDRKSDFFLIIFNIPVHIHYTARFFHHFLYLTGNLYLPFIIRTIHLRYNRTQHGGTGRNLHHLYICVIFAADLLDKGPYSFGDIVALRLSLPPLNKIHLYVRDIASGPQEVVPHESVKIKGRGRAGVYLIVRYFRNGLEIFTDLP